MITRMLLALHARASRTPYYDIWNDGSQYMVRDWLLGARSPERNADNPFWKKAGFDVAPPKSSGLYRAICRRICARAHTILRSDSDRHLHDHPSWSISIVLDGGYWEICEPTRFALCVPLMYRGAIDSIEQGWIAPEHADEHDYLKALGIHWRKPGAIVFRKATAFHRIVLPRGVVAKSIFIMGPRTNHWGFLVNSKKVPWREYLGIKEKA
ncbi:hypothetical protein [Paraburkholderia sacchari]|uniref:hypothetical protein n=1 Tax=Paraburkholderia sacchari TaxID=159450 RepID=UPI001BCF2369|nr:hypothetical protein [Paraburkholderia sacchari]